MANRVVVLLGAALVLGFAGVYAAQNQSPRVLLPLVVATAAITVIFLITMVVGAARAGR